MQSLSPVDKFFILALIAVAAIFGVMMLSGSFRPADHQPTIPVIPLN